jgi:hypothetical protein
MCWQLLVKLPNTKFHENLFSASCVVAYGQTDTVKLVGVFLQLFVLKTPDMICITIYFHGFE